MSTPPSPRREFNRPRNFILIHPHVLVINTTAIWLIYQFISIDGIIIQLLLSILANLSNLDGGGGGGCLIELSIRKKSGSLVGLVLQKFPEKIKRRHPHFVEILREKYNLYVVFFFLLYFIFAIFTFFYFTLYIPVLKFVFIKYRKQGIIPSYASLKNHVFFTLPRVSFHARHAWDLKNNVKRAVHFALHVFFPHAGKT